MCLVMCKRHSKHCYVKCVKNDSRKKGNLKTHTKKHNDILVPSQRYQDSRHILQNPTFPNNVIGFSNCAQRFTVSNYLVVDSPFLLIKNKLVSIFFNQIQILMLTDCIE